MRNSSFFFADASTTRALATQADRSRTAAETGLATAQQSFAVMRQALGDLTKKQYEAGMMSRIDALQAQASKTETWILLALGFGLVVAAVAGWLVARSISRSVGTT